MESQEPKKKSNIVIYVVVFLLLALWGNFMILPKIKGLFRDDTPVAVSGELENGKQIVNIAVNGGYSPSTSIAKADTPSIIRFTTNKTFDCSTALVIKQLNVSKSLSPSGTYDVEIPPQAKGTEIKGSCSMGMYFFKVRFE